MKDKSLKRRGIMRLFRGGDSGQALVETALTMPFLCSLLVGSVELARVTYFATEVTNAARAAVQYGAMNGGGWTDTAGMLAAAQADAGDITGSGLSFVAGYPTESCSCSGPVGSGTAASCGPPATGCSASNLVVSVTVMTKAQLDPLIHLPGLPPTYWVYGTASEQVLQ